MESSICGHNAIENIKSNISNYLGIQWFRSTTLKPCPGEQCLGKEEALHLPHVISEGMKCHSGSWFIKHCANWAFLLSLFRQLGFTVLIGGFRPANTTAFSIVIREISWHLNGKGPLILLRETRGGLWNLPHEFASSFTLNKQLILLGMVTFWLSLLFESGQELPSLLSSLLTSFRFLYFHLKNTANYRLTQCTLWF